MSRRSDVLARLDTRAPVQPADDEARIQTAREFLDAVAWDGETPDPDLLNGREFLAWL